jgi:hypothetical protein
VNPGEDKEECLLAATARTKVTNVDKLTKQFKKMKSMRGVTEASFVEHKIKVLSPSNVFWFLSLPFEKLEHIGYVQNNILNISFYAQVGSLVIIDCTDSKDTLSMDLPKGLLNQSILAFGEDESDGEEEDLDTEGADDDDVLEVDEGNGESFDWDEDDDGLLEEDEEVEGELEEEFNCEADEELQDVVEDVEAAPSTLPVRHSMLFVFKPNLKFCLSSCTSCYLAWLLFE